MDSDNGYVKGRWGRRGHAQCVAISKLSGTWTIVNTTAGIHPTLRGYPGPSAPKMTNTIPKLSIIRQALGPEWA